MKIIALSRFHIQTALVSSAAILVALVIVYFGWAHSMWLVLSAFILSVPARGAILRQSFILFIIIVISVLLAVHLQTKIPLAIWNSVFTCVFVGISIGAYFYEPISKQLLFLLFLFSLLLMIAVSHSSPILVQDQLLDIIVGSLIGVLCRQLISPANFNKQFSQDIIPTLNELFAFNQRLTQAVKDKKISLPPLSLDRITYPEWVYEVGFNPGLRAGFRFFTVHLERVMELFYALHYQLTHHNEDAEPLSDLLIISMQKNGELLQVLSDYFKQHTLGKIETDFTQDIANLENNLREKIPSQLELLDLSPQYLYLTALVRDIKDMRQLLLQLIMSLQSK